MNKVVAFILASIKGGSTNYQRAVAVPYSGTALNLLKLLQINGYISGYRQSAPHKILIELHYSDSIPNVQKIKLYSTPGRRLYLPYEQLLIEHSLQECIILSTSRGFLTLVDAYQLGIGGQVVCKIN